MKKRLLHGLVTCVVASSMIVTPVLATPQDKVDSIKNKKKAAEAEAASVNEELVGLLLDLDALKQDMKIQEKRIDQAEDDLEVAKEKEKEQYEAMKLRIKYMYEEGDTSFIETLLSAESFTDLVNKAEYVQKVHKYDRTKLTEYVETKNEVAELKESLETGQAEMESMADEMTVQKSNLESTLTTMRSEIADFDIQLAAAEAEAAAELERLTQESQQIASNAGNGNANNNSNSSVSNNGNTTESKPSGNNGNNNNSNNNNNNNNNNGSNDNDKEENSKPDKEETTSPPSNASLGQQIANKGCQYIGNKYVYGGNSLTNGIDCSGFVQQIHALFGISTPRSSSSLRYGGKAVAYSDMLPGDVICYSGHVAIYIGNNTIVHASNSAPYPKGGIKTTSPANYRTVLAVRRYW